MGSICDGKGFRTCLKDRGFHRICSCTVDLPFGLTLHHVRVVDPSEIDRYQFESDRCQFATTVSPIVTKALDY